MDTARLTDERLRFGLNGDQPSRERLCLGILSLDRNYSSIKPRRPEGGPDGGRDIECMRSESLCFGAVGFKNSVSDSTSDKTDAKNKFRADLKTARQSSESVKQFVFFCNIDLTPGEVDELSEIAKGSGFTHVDIYYRERMRMFLDSAEGLALRFQYLSIPLSEAEQAAFFSRYGKDLEDLVRGRFDRIEKKIDDIEFARWKAGNIKSMSLSIEFKELMESKQEQPEHFRVALVLQALAHESERDIVIGGRDEFHPNNDGTYHFGTKSFFFLRGLGSVAESWVPSKGARMFGGLVPGMTFGITWRPFSPIHVSDLEGLMPGLVLTENLADRITRVKFRIDDYVFRDYAFSVDRLKSSRPGFEWPDALTEEEEQLRLVCDDWRTLSLDHAPPKEDGASLASHHFGVTRASR